MSTPGAATWTLWMPKFEKLASSSSRVVAATEMSVSSRKAPG
jgi:hypothetical protein